MAKLFTGRLKQVAWVCGCILPWSIPILDKVAHAFGICLGF
jgi:hypothetical protein